MDTEPPAEHTDEYYRIMERGMWMDAWTMQAAAEAFHRNRRARKEQLRRQGILHVNNPRNELYGHEIFPEHEETTMKIDVLIQKALPATQGEMKALTTVRDVDYTAVLSTETECRHTERTRILFIEDICSLCRRFIQRSTGGRGGGTDTQRDRVHYYMCFKDVAEQINAVLRSENITLLGTLKFFAWCLRTDITERDADAAEAGTTYFRAMMAVLAEHADKSRIAAAKSGIPNMTANALRRNVRTCKLLYEFAEHRLKCCHHTMQPKTAAPA